MCRNIKTLFNFEPPATEAEIRAASLQFVRKLSGFNSPSKANQPAFDRAIEEVALAAQVLIASLVTTADPRDREIEAARARARTAARFGVSGVRFLAVALRERVEGCCIDFSPTRFCSFTWRLYCSLDLADCSCCAGASRVAAFAGSVVGHLR